MRHVWIFIHKSIPGNGNVVGCFVEVLPNPRRPLWMALSPTPPSATFYTVLSFGHCLLNLVCVVYRSSKDLQGANEALPTDSRKATSLSSVQLPPCLWHWVFTVQFAFLLESSQYSMLLSLRWDIFMLGCWYCNCFKFPGKYLAICIKNVKNVYICVSSCTSSKSVSCVIYQIHILECSSQCNLWH